MINYKNTPDAPQKVNDLVQQKFPNFKMTAYFAM